MEYIPPKPIALNQLQSLVRSAYKGDGNFLELIPDTAFDLDVVPFGRRGGLLVNNPKMTKEILHDEKGSFYKSDILVGSIEDLGGKSLFISTGEKWARDKQMLAPAYYSLRSQQSFDTILETVNEFIENLPRTFSLDYMMYYLTSDVMYRLMFSKPIGHHVSKQMFDDWSLFKRLVSSRDIVTSVTNPSRIQKQPPIFYRACRRIRSQIEYEYVNNTSKNNIADLVINAKDKNGNGFTKEDIVDQLTVFFLSGHETTASVLTWIFYILTQQPQHIGRMRTEIKPIYKEGLTQKNLNKLEFTKAFFQETLRLYPPSTVFPRCPKQDIEIEGHKFIADNSILVIPYVIHRHNKYWVKPNTFIPDRFLPENKDKIIPGTYIPFGGGPHICAGSAFAQTEALVVMANMIMNYDFELHGHQHVEPAHRLTTCPKKQIQIRIKCRY